MGITRPQRVKQMHELQASGRIQPDASGIVHRFDDGWTIRRLVTAGCVRREGYLMRNCCAKYVGDEKDTADTNPGAYLDGSVRHTTRFRRREAHTVPSTRGQMLYSLRDADNLPHVTMWANPGWYLRFAFGFRNEEQLKTEYLDRLHAWCEAAGMTYVPIPAIMRRPDRPVDGVAGIADLILQIAREQEEALAPAERSADRVLNARFQGLLVRCTNLMFTRSDLLRETKLVRADVLSMHEQMVEIMNDLQGAQVNRMHLAHLHEHCDEIVRQIDALELLPDAHAAMMAAFAPR